MKRLYFIAVAGLCACQNVPQDQIKIVAPPAPITNPQAADYSDLYLQGTFNWWHAEPSYKVQKVGNQLYKVSTKLVADGNDYQFIFADKIYSGGKTCGAANVKSSSVKAGSEKVAANCRAENSYFKFKPLKTAVYDFFFDYNNLTPKVYIK